MNKKYSINEEGIVSVLTDNGEIIREEKFNKNTEEILALENVIESLNNKTNWFNQEIINLKDKIKYNMLFMISQIIISVFLILIFNLLSLNLITLNSLLIIGLTEIFLISTIAMKILKYENKIEKYNKKINHINSIINKANKKINNLSVNNTKTKIEKTNEYQDVKVIYEYNFDSNDYFINKYNIDKRTQEFTNPKSKVRKLTKKSNQELLKYYK